MTDYVMWYSGIPPFEVRAYIGDGLKVYPNPAREFSGGTVMRDIAPCLNTYNGCGVATVILEGSP